MRVHPQTFAPLLLAASWILLAPACGEPVDDDGHQSDAGSVDAAPDSGTDGGYDGGAPDASYDGGDDGGTPDAGYDGGYDGGDDGGTPDASSDAGVDGGDDGGLADVVTPCAEISALDNYSFISGPNYYLGTPNPALGGADPDETHLFFFSDLTGAFNLAAPPNDNYATCEQCLMVLEDVGPNGAVRQYFPSEGYMEIVGNESPRLGNATINLYSVRLVEVSIDPITWVSTPVPGGACVQFTDLVLVP
ncbi:MAG: hypothetical protein P1V51_07130 [Deltaproteobacteria bacterium]|nr:hypothetical protein [Deltaproteobacteria bacterium]